MKKDVSVLSTGSSMALAAAQTRYRAWMANLKGRSLWGTEYLLPQLPVPCPRALPELMASGEQRREASDDELKQRIQQLRPWGYGIQLRKGVKTENHPVALERMIFRSHLISGAIRQLIGEAMGTSSFIDFACNHGYFTLEMAHFGALNALGIDMRAENVAKAQFLRDHFEIAAARFVQQDIYALNASKKYDVVMNLGILYHITDPYRLMKLSYDLCRRFAVVDSIMHKEPVSAFIQCVNKNTENHAEGKFSVELHPTYRAVIDLMHAVGFRQIIEVVRAPAVNGDDCPHDLYDRHDRRCLIGFKEPVDIPGVKYLERQR